MKDLNLKYKQIVNYVIDGINDGSFKKGDWIPSVNEFREKYSLSRDTVFAGLRELKSKGIIASHPGVGYYISSTKIPHKHNIFLLFNEINEFKEDLYNSFMEAIGNSVTVDLFFHNYNQKVFENLLNEANGKYTAYVIMTGKFEYISTLLESISGKIYLLDHFHLELKEKYSSVYQNFEKDTFEALNQGIPKLIKYSKIIMVQKETKEPIERYYGLRTFCKIHGFGHEYVDSLENRTILRGEVYMLVKDRDLADLIKKGEQQHLKLGEDFGIISYNDTPLKEVLAGGITTLSTNFEKMGKIMAELINKKGIHTIENESNLIIRNSL